MFVIDGAGTLVYMGAIDDRPTASLASVRGATSTPAAPKEIPDVIRRRATLLRNRSAHPCTFCPRVPGCCHARQGTRAPEKTRRRSEWVLLAESTPGSRLIAIDRIDMTFVTVPNFKGRAKSAAKGCNNTQ